MTTPPAPAGPGGYEKSDLRTRPIVLFAVLLTVVTVLGFVASYGMIRFLGWWDRDRLQTPASTLATRTLPPEPRLQVDAPRDLRTLRAAEEETLTTYGWVSREAGVARIPIARAMELILERGLPKTTPATAPAPPQGAAP
jgi:hypothetical protein